MDDGLKQRLMGAIVLVALAVIFIPMIFNEAKVSPDEIKVTIPPRPEIHKFERVKPQLPVSQVGPAAVSVATVDTEQQQAVPKTIKPVKMPESWTLQLASFQERANADILRDSLRKAGYKAYVKYRANQKPALARVFVGPELNRKVIDKLKSTLHKEFKLEGIVLRFIQDS